jgi:hypothetical protein
MRRYFIFSVFLIGAIGLFVFIEDNSVTTFNILGVELSLPNALWVVIFLSVYLIFSLAFLGFSNLKNIFYQKNVTKDIQTIIENIKNKIFYKNAKKDVKVLKDINNFVELIEGLNIVPKSIEKFEFLEDIKKIENGEVVDLKKYKLDNSNPWVIKNARNKLKKDPSYAKELLKKPINEELKKEAFYIWAKEASVDEILKYDYEITLEIILAHIENLKKELLEKAKLTPLEEIEVARAIYHTKDPDRELEMISPLKWGYAYLALKYEHIELAKEIIEENNLKFFEYFIKLKEAGVKADIDEYIDSRI